MTRRKTDAQFKKEVYDLVEDEYEFLDTYVNNRTKIRVKHNKCGNTYKVNPYSFFSGHRCPYCSGNAKKTDTEFKKEVYDLVGNEYTFLDNYVDATTKLRVKHNNCGHVYKVKPNNFLGCHNRCPYCNGKIKKTDAQFKQEVFELIDDEYTFLDTYVNGGTKIQVKHNKCGTIYKVRPRDFLSGRRCPYCAKLNQGNKLAKTDDQFKQEVKNLVGNEYSFLDTYVNGKTKMRIKHNKCGNVYFVTPTDFFSKHSRCPYCSSPKGETLINKILKLLNIKYEYQKTFDDLKDTQLLSYDFFLPTQNILIEYQGIQHYEPVDYFGGDDKFKYQQKHDKMKSEYAKAHHYNLITVPYTEDTFSKIKKYLLSHGLSK